MNNGVCKNNIFVECFANNPDFSNCGWNPEVSAERADKIRGKRLAEHTNRSQAKRIQEIIAEARK